MKHLAQLQQQTTRKYNGYFRRYDTSEKTPEPATPDWRETRKAKAGKTRLPKLLQLQPERKPYKKLYCNDKIVHEVDVESDATYSHRDGGGGVG